MKITAVASFPKYKDGIPRATEELISKLCEANSVESVSVITKESKAFVSPSLSKNKKVSLFTPRSFLLPWTLLRIIKLYWNSDVFLLFAHPCYVFDPLQPLCYFQLLIKCRVLPRAKMVQMLYDFANYACPEDYVALSKRTKFTLQLSI